MPRFAKGQPILHDDFNKLAEAIEDAGRLQVDTSTGLQLAGKTISYVPQRVASVGVVASAIGPCSGMQAGKGTVNLCYKDDNDTFQPYGDSPEDCFNTTPATANVGDLIQLKYAENGYWLWDVASCS